LVKVAPLFAQTAVKLDAESQASEAFATDRQLETDTKIQLPELEDKDREQTVS
jgi:hypothetical protein